MALRTSNSTANATASQQRPSNDSRQEEVSRSSEGGSALGGFLIAIAIGVSFAKIIAPALVVTNAIMDNASDSKMRNTSSNSNVSNIQQGTDISPKPRLDSISRAPVSRATIELLSDVPPPLKTATPSPVSASSRNVSSSIDSEHTTAAAQSRKSETQAKRSSEPARTNQTSTAQATRQDAVQASTASVAENKPSLVQHAVATAQPKNELKFMPQSKNGPRLVPQSKNKQTRDEVNNSANSDANQTNSRANDRVAEAKNTPVHSPPEIKVASPPLPSRPQSAASNNQQRVQQQAAQAQAKAAAEARANVYLEEKDEQRPVYSERTDARGLRERRSVAEVRQANNAPLREVSDMQRISEMFLTLTKNSNRSDAQFEEMRFEMGSMKREMEENQKNSAKENQKFREEMTAEIKALKAKKSIFSRLRSNHA
ncbi:MAG: hypothetical protein V4629_10035 [Pseudomonadota bacterium]